MEFSFLIYISTLLIAVYIAYKGDLSKTDSKKGVYFILSLLPIIFISGFRNKVGTDAPGYEAFYYALNTSTPFSQTIKINLINVEPGYLILNLAFRMIGASFSVVLLVIAILTWSLIYYSTVDYIKKFHIVIYFAITFGFLFFTFNGIRQSIAMAFAFYSIKYLVKGNKLKFTLIIIIASLFHYSAILLIPLFWVISKIRFSKETWFVILFVSVFIPEQIFFSLIGKISSYLPGYYGYYEKIMAYQDKGISLGHYYQIAIGFIPLIYYDALYKKGKYQKVVFNLALMGTVFYSIFWANKIISRFTAYFLMFEIFAFSIIFEYLIEKKKYSDLIIYTVLIFSVFIYKIYMGDSGCSPFTFKF